jgi:hypothetical protein
MLFILAAALVCNALVFAYKIRSASEAGEFHRLNSASSFKSFLNMIQSQIGLYERLYERFGMEYTVFLGFRYIQARAVIYITSRHYNNSAGRSLLSGTME